MLIAGDIGPQLWTPVLEQQAQHGLQEPSDGTVASLTIDQSLAWRQEWDMLSQVKNVEPTSSPACMSPSESRTTSSANLASTLPTSGGAGLDEDSDPLADLPDLVSSSFDSGDGRM
jgi:hypothetical protein